MSPPTSFYAITDVTCSRGFQSDMSSLAAGCILVIAGNPAHSFMERQGSRSKVNTSLVSTLRLYRLWENSTALLAFINVCAQGVMVVEIVQLALCRAVYFHGL